MHIQSILIDIGSSTLDLAGEYREEWVDTCPEKSEEVGYGVLTLKARHSALQTPEESSQRYGSWGMFKPTNPKNLGAP